MVRTFEGNLSADSLRVAIVASRFNHFITERLVGGAVDCLVRHGAASEHISVVWAPGSWELPLVARRIAETGQFDAVVCVGAVIRGGTPHFDYVASEVSKGIARVAMSLDMPLTFGVLTTDTIEQAIERAGTKAGNKGWEAALAAIETANLLTHIESLNEREV